MERSQDPERIALMSAVVLVSAWPNTRTASTAASAPSPSSSTARRYNYFDNIILN